MRGGPIIDHCVTRTVLVAMVVMVSAVLPVHAEAAPARATSTCLDETPTITGTRGDDVIYGTGGPDVIIGLGGQDVINARGGKDIVCGGGGRDTIRGGRGTDTLRGGDGNDRLSGNSGRDHLGGGSGDDFLEGNPGDDLLNGNAGFDRLFGGLDSDVCLNGEVTKTCEEVVPPTDIALSNSTVPENEPSGTAVGNLSATDPDAGQIHTFSLVSGTGGTDNASFAIASNQLRTAAFLDYESKATRSIRVRADDGQGGTYEEVFLISVTDAVITADRFADWVEPTSGWSAPVAVSPGLIIDDPVSSMMLSGATVTLVVGSGDELLWTDPDGGSTGPTLDPSSGRSGGINTLQFTGVASAAQYESALRAVKFDNFMNGTEGSDRTVTFGVQSNSDGGASADTTTVTITPTNDLPVAVLRATPESPHAYSYVVFDGSASSGSGDRGSNGGGLEDGLASWVLELGDGSPDKSGTGPPPAATPHTYTSEGTYVAKLTVTADSGETGEDTVTITVKPQASSDLRLDISDSPDPATVGQELTYTITVTNAGPDSVAPVVKDWLDDEVTFVSATTSEGDTCSRSGAEITCTFYDTPSGGTDTVTIVVTPNRAVQVENRAEVSSATEAVRDPDYTNNADTESTVVQEPVS